MKRVLICLLLCVACVALPAQRVGPLIDAPWGQGVPFNGRCPLYDGYPVEVGCVATAMTQIMAYYRYPECTLDTLYGWRTDHIVADTVPPGARIDWEHIRSDYRSAYTQAEADAVADLSLYAALAVHMNFGRNSSGADASRYVKELPRVFGYSTCIECDRAYYTQDGWRQLLVAELECGRPVLYTAYNMDFSGHAFVLDGYDYATGRFHANWGYDGTFDGWVDIDVMGQFEHPDDLTFWGQREGMYCNHTALLVHPTERIHPAADSIQWHDGDVTVERIQPVGALHTGGYQLLDIHLASHRTDTIAYTFEVLSNAPQDTALFRQADYVALGCVVLQPGESRVFRTSARFACAGERVLRLSNDDVSLMGAVSVTVAEGSAMHLDIDQPQVTYLSDTEATLSVPMRAVAGESGALVTYCLFQEGSDEDLRHWQLVTERELTDAVTFRCLKPSTTYTLRVRCPWDVRAECTFTTAAAGETSVLQPQVHRPGSRVYDLNGRRVLPRGTHIYKKTRNNGRLVIDN